MRQRPEPRAMEAKAADAAHRNASLVLRISAEFQCQSSLTSKARQRASCRDYDCTAGDSEAPREARGGNDKTPERRTAERRTLRLNKHGDRPLKRAGTIGPLARTSRDRRSARRTSVAELSSPREAQPPNTIASAPLPTPPHPTPPQS